MCSSRFPSATSRAVDPVTTVGKTALPSLIRSTAAALRVTDGGDDGANSGIAGPSHARHRPMAAGMMTALGGPGVRGAVVHPVLQIEKEGGEEGVVSSDCDVMRRDCALLCRPSTVMLCYKDWCVPSLLSSLSRLGIQQGSLCLHALGCPALVCLTLVCLRDDMHALADDGLTADHLGNGLE